jgi:hypothetical protein
MAPEPQSLQHSNTQFCGIFNLCTRCPGQNIWEKSVCTCLQQAWALRQSASASEKYFMKDCVWTRGTRCDVMCEGPRVSGCRTTAIHVIKSHRLRPKGTCTAAICLTSYPLRGNSYLCGNVLSVHFGLSHGYLHVGDL